MLNVCVDALMQRAGCGRQLIAHLLEVGATAEFSILCLEVRPTNAAALALYQQFGFSEIGRRPNYYPAADGREDAVMLAWEPTA